MSKTAMDLRIEPIKREDWGKLTAGFADHNFQNTWSYSELLAGRQGAACEHVAIRENGDVIGAACVRIKKLPVVGGGLAYVASGPLVRRGGEDTDVGARLEKCLAALTREYAEGRGMVVRLLSAIGDPSWNELAAKVCTETGFARTEQAAGYRTMLMDLSPSMKDIRAKVKQKWRYHLNGAEKKNLKLLNGTSMELMGRFRELFDRFHKRKGFETDLDAEFYSGVQEQLGEEEKLSIWLAENGDGKAIGGHVSSMLGDTCVYLLGATDEEGLENKAGYVLHWRVMEEAKGRGCTRYDLCGIDPEGNPGTYQFKAGTNGADVTAAGPFEFSRGTWRSSMTLRAERLYRSLKKSKAGKTD